MKLGCCERLGPGVCPPPLHQPETFQFICSFNLTGAGTLLHNYLKTMMTIVMMMIIMTVMTMMTMMMMIMTSSLGMTRTQGAGARLHSAARKLLLSETF